MTVNRRPTQDPGPHTSTHSQGARPGPRHLGHFAGTYLASWAQIPVETQVLKKYFNVYENLGISALAPQGHLPPARPPLGKCDRPGRPGSLSHTGTREGARPTSCITSPAQPP